MSTYKALIVDDEPDIRELLELTLSRMDVETFTAANIESALVSLEQEKFDLCITDMNLPDGNGIDLVKHIQANYQTCKKGSRRSPFTAPECFRR